VCEGYITVCVSEQPLTSIPQVSASALSRQTPRSQIHDEIVKLSSS